MADSRRKFNMATILNDKARTVCIWGCKNGLTVQKTLLNGFYRICFIIMLMGPRSIFKMAASTVKSNMAVFHNYGAFCLSFDNMIEHIQVGICVIYTVFESNFYEIILKFQDG